MSLKITEADEAVNDVLDAADFIAEQSGLDRSDKFLQAVKNSYRQLADMPGIGSLWDYGQPELKGMRRWHVTGFAKYLIFYSVSESEMKVLRVMHGARDIKTAFIPPME